MCVHVQECCVHMNVCVCVKRVVCTCTCICVKLNWVNIVYYKQQTIET